MTSSVRRQYEEFPYPPVPFLALPSRRQGERLSYERGCRKAYGQERSHKDIRILVAGAGTLEALVVAQAHPRAAEVLAVDLSAASLRILEKRDRLARIVQAFLKPWRRRPAPIRTLRTDLLEWNPTERYDYILASNLLQHVPDPAALLRRLASWLKPEGVLRIVTYPKASRIWMRETSRYLRSQGVRAGDVTDARRAIERLPASHPVRSCFESQPERFTPTGLTDAFFHACENPLSPLEWREACATAGLLLEAEDQDENSQSSFLTELLPATRTLDRWSRLQILDDLLEICANPVLWLRPGNISAATVSGATEPAVPSAEIQLRNTDLLSPSAREELLQAVRRADRLLRSVGVTIHDAIEALRREVGPRVTAPPEERPLPGLSVIEYF